MVFCIRICLPFDSRDPGSARRATTGDPIVALRLRLMESPYVDVILKVELWFLALVDKPKVVPH